MMIAYAFSGAGWALFLLGAAALYTQRLKTHQAYGVCALGTVAWLLADAVARVSERYILIDTAFCAYYTWRWWTTGGDDDTKRRLRRWARKWSPVRRTAPQGA